MEGFHRAAVSFLLLGAIGLPSAASATDLEQVVEDQARRIEQLEAEQLLLRERLDATEEAAAAATEEPAAPAASDEADGAVDREYVDQRIEDFEDAAASRFLISGYGTTGLTEVQNGSTAFDVSFNPGFHFRMTELLHFVAELEIELEVEDREVEAEFGLEFAQIDYLATDWLAFSGGLFLTPFNTFGPWLHPTWINKSASPPPIYGGQHGSGGFIPVLSTLGAMASGGTALWNDDAKVNYAFFVGNGPTAEELEDQPQEHELLELDFGNTPDLDDGVSFGGRLGFLPIGNLEFGVSYTTSDPDDARFHLVGTDAWYSWQGLELRGEFAYLTREAGSVEATVWGYWLQAAYRLRFLFPGRSGFEGVLNRLEPVIRWGEVRDFPETNRDQIAAGLNFWLFETAPLKLSYEVNDGEPDDNRFLVAFAYGF